MSPEKDFSRLDPEELWARFRPAPGRLDRGRKARQLNLRVDHLWLDRVEALAAHRHVGPYTLARVLLAQALNNTVDLAAQVAPRAEQVLHFNFRLEDSLLSRLKAQASANRRPYHALGRDLIWREVEAAWNEVAPSRSPLDLQQLLVLLLGAPGANGEPHAPISGATAADKLLFLISRAIPPRLRPAFEPYHFGPWDETLLDTEQALLASGLASRHAAARDAQTLDPVDAEFSHSSLVAMSEHAERPGDARPLHLTSRGVRAAEEWTKNQRLLEPADAEALLNVIATIKQRYGGLPNDKLISEVYQQYPAYASKSRLLRDSKNEEERKR
jgi:predicted DNA binding CopG/RHH family protein